MKISPKKVKKNPAVPPDRGSNDADTENIPILRRAIADRETERPKAHREHFARKGQALFSSSRQHRARRSLSVVAEIFPLRGVGCTMMESRFPTQAFQPEDRWPGH
jgi:hypothetical protein